MNNYLASLRERYRAAGAAAHEIVGVIVCVLLGLIVVPCLIWLVGRFVLVGRFALGPYAHGGIFALWSDFMHGLAAGWLSFWVVALGPLGFYLLFRGIRRLVA